MRDTRFVKVLGNYMMQIKFVLVISAVSIVLLVAALPSIQPGTTTYVLTLIQLVTFTGLFVLMTGLLWIVRAAD